MQRFHRNTMIMAIGLILMSCTNQVFFNPFRIGHNINTIEVPENFDWTLTTKVDLGVEFELVGDSLGSLEGERIYLLDTNFRVLTRGIIHNNTSSLFYKVPFNLGLMYAYLPLTQNFEYIYSTACLGTLKLRYGWQGPDEDLGLEYLEFPFSENDLDGFKSDYAFKASVFANSGFDSDELKTESRFDDEEPQFDGSWYRSTSNKAEASIEAYQGNPALKFGQQKGKKVEVWQAVSWSDEGKFTVQLQAISPSSDRIKVKLSLYFLERDGSKYDTEEKNSKSYNIKNPSGWQTLEVSGTVDDNIDAIVLMIEDQGGSDDPYYIDDITTNYDTDDDADDDGIPDEEDEYPDDPLRAFNDYYPSDETNGTLAFEDLWPAKGDYDFNDLVVDYRFNQVKNADNKIIELLATISLKAIGGSFHNGFGIELPLSQELVSSVSGNELQEGMVDIRNNGTENGNDNAVIIVFEDAWNYLRVAGVSFVNVRSDAAQVDPYVFNVVISFSRPLTDQEFGSPPYNPFIFTNGRRSVEVHLFGQQPTAKMDLGMLGTDDDYSDSGQGHYFKTASNLPWALDIPAEFSYPEEKSPVDSAYNYFIEWAETGGSSKNDWYQSKEGYRNTAKIFRKN